MERRDLALNESLERTLPDLLSARGLTGVSLSSDQYASLDAVDDTRFLGVFGLVRGSEVVDHSDPSLGETSLLDGQEPDDELGGPMWNMMAVLYGEDSKKSCCEVKSEYCDCAEREVNVMLSW